MPHLCFQSDDKMTRARVIGWGGWGGDNIVTDRRGVTCAFELMTRARVRGRGDNIVKQTGGGSPVLSTTTPKGYTNEAEVAAPSSPNLTPVLPIRYPVPA